MYLNNYTVVLLDRSKSNKDMKKTTILGLVATFAFLSTFSLSVSAATYLYINTAGNIQTVEAISASQALAIAPNISAHSGVMLYSGLPTVITSVNVNQTFPYVTYQYVNTMGQVQTVIASSSAEAFSLATNIDPNSGVMRVGIYQDGV